jgi:hypothetical protein
MYHYTSSTHTFNLGGSYAVPIGLAVKIVVVSTIGTQNYYEIINVPAVTSGLSVPSTPAPATLSDIQTAINSLEAPFMFRMHSIKWKPLHLMLCFLYHYLFATILKFHYSPLV